MAVNIIQQQDGCEQTHVRSERCAKTPVLGKSDMTSNSRQILAYRDIGAGVLSLAIFSASGTSVAGGLAALIFDGWVVAVAAILGGVWGLFTAALCQVAGAEAQKEYHLHSNLATTPHRVHSSLIRLTHNLKTE